MTFKELLYNYFTETNENPGKKLTNAEIDDKVTADDVKAIYLQYHIHGELDHHRHIRLPLGRRTTEFTDHQELKEHIKADKPRKRKHYFYDQKDEETQKVVLQAFKERKCEKLRKKKQSKQEQIQDLEKEIQQLNCDSETQ